MVSKNLSVCLSRLSMTNFNLNNLRTGKIERAEIFLGYLCVKSYPKHISRPGAVMAWAESLKANLLAKYFCKLVFVSKTANL